MSISVSLTEFQDSINKKGIYTMFKKLFTVALLAAASVLSAGDVLFDGLKEPTAPHAVRFRPGSEWDCKPSQAIGAYRVGTFTITDKNTPLPML